MCIPNKPVYVQRGSEATTLAFISSRLLNSILYWHDNNSQYSNLYEHEQDTQTPDQIDSSNLQQQVTTVTQVSDRYSGIHEYTLDIQTAYSYVEQSTPTWQRFKQSFQCST